ncbi:MAG: copG family protein, putative anti-toxin protein [candidate division NC10 bacterium]|nr:copG family protein, putative anti-toxin protein [candidate division NC10 bacterium]
MPVSVSVRIPDETAEALDAVVRATDRTKTYLVLQALEIYLQEYADYQVALDRLLNKRDPVISSRELRQRLAAPARKPVPQARRR